jgi:hypothetical protein
MGRARLVSLLGLLCSLLLAASLLIAVDPYPPGLPYFLWGLCGVLFVASVGLWLQKRWAHIVFLVAGTIFLLQYAAAVFLAPHGCAGTWVGCYRHYVRSEPMLAVIHRLVEVTCSPESVRCYTSSMYLLSAPMIVAMALLLKPLASNNLYGVPRQAPGRS